MLSDQLEMVMLSLRYGCSERDLAYHVAMRAALKGQGRDDDDAEEPGAPGDAAA